MIPDDVPETEAERAYLRDMFAAHALSGMLAHPRAWERPVKNFATDAYAYADRMMEARAR